MTEDICCPNFDPKPWDEKIFEWNNKTFIKEKVSTFLYMPLNFGKVMKKVDKKLRNANVSIPDNLCLSDHTSKWRMNLYLAVDKEVSDMQNTTIHGKFLSKVYEGPFKDTGKWCKDFEAYANSKDVCISHLYMWYTTCPTCAKKYGKNYVVIIGKIGT